MDKFVISDKAITYDYDSTQDMLYILFEPVTNATFYDDVPNMPGVMLRYTVNDERLVGITAHDVSRRLSPITPQDTALRHLAQKLVKQLV